MNPTSGVNLPSANPWLAQSARITEIREELSDTATYKLAFEEPAFAANYRFLPGQFNMLYLPGFGESAISISSDPERLETVSHTIRVAGNVTRALTRHQVGDQILMRGPFGSAWPLEQLRGKDVVIASGGIGLAPLRPAIYQILNRREEYGRVYLLYGARTPGGLLYTDEYAAWRDAGIEVKATVDIADVTWKGHIGVVPMLFDQLKLEPQQTRILTCGPEIMMRFVVFEGISRGISREHTFISMERNMQCAVGFCGHCQLGPAFVCKDGPVFSYKQMEPFLNLEDF